MLRASRIIGPLVNSKHRQARETGRCVGMARHATER